MDPNKVVDDSNSPSYKNVYNKGEYQRRADVDAYAEFMKEEEIEREVMSGHSKW